MICCYSVPLATLRCSTWQLRGVCCCVRPCFTKAALGMGPDGVVHGVRRARARLRIGHFGSPILSKRMQVHREDTPTCARLRAAVAAVMATADTKIARALDELYEHVTGDIDAAEAALLQYNPQIFRECRVRTKAGCLLTCACPVQTLAPVAICIALCERTMAHERHMRRAAQVADADEAAALKAQLCEDTDGRQATGGGQLARVAQRPGRAARRRADSAAGGRCERAAGRARGGRAEAPHSGSAGALARGNLGNHPRARKRHRLAACWASCPVLRSAGTIA